MSVVKSRGSARRVRRQAHEQLSTTNTMHAGTDVSVPYAPLTDQNVQRVHTAALDLLERVGMSNVTPVVQSLAEEKGCRISDHGRLLFPRALIEDLLAGANRAFIVHGRDPAFDFEAKSGRVNFCTGGAAVKMLDMQSGRYRASRLSDLYDLARLADRLPNIQWFARPVVATDVSDPFELDANTLFACAAGTRKHIATSFSKGEHVERLIPMLDLLAGGGGEFRKRPFCTVHATTVVSPMSFAEDSLEVAIAAVKAGMPVHCQTGPQAGATAPAALAGTLAQGCAESLASLAVVNLLKPGHPVVLGNWVFVSDLRTGAFSGGGGEQALLGAASGQMSRFYGIPGGMGAGMTDSKLPDNQAGFEKALTLALAALSGSGMVYESTGMLASLLGCSFEAMVIDDDMLSSIRRIARGIEVNDDTLSVDVIRDVVEGPGHFLGEQQTLGLMNSEFSYPRIADRLSPDEWDARGARDIRQRAKDKAEEILSAHCPEYIDSRTNAELRDRYRIHLSSPWSNS